MQPSKVKVERLSAPLKPLALRLVKIEKLQQNETNEENPRPGFLNLKKEQILQPENVEVKEEQDVKPKLVPFSGTVKQLKIQAFPPNISLKRKKKNFICDICNKGVGTKGGMVYHMNAHLFGRPFKCNICSRCYSTKNDLSTHSKSHKNEQYFCDFCGSCHSAKQYLSTHISYVHLPKTVRCKYCTKTKFFSTKSVLKKHIYICHTYKKPAPVPKFECKMCNLKMVCKSQYLKHCSVRELLKFKCPACRQKFPCPLLLKKHRQEERKNAPTFCNVCKVDLPADNYQRHVVSNHGNYKCDLCDFKTTMVAHFSKHLKTCGTKEEICTLGFECKICKQFFRTKFALNAHVNKAHGDFKCTPCSKSFRSLEKLNGHNKYHKKMKKLGQERYICLACPVAKYFRSRKTFNAHFANRHMHYKIGKIMYECDKCKIMSSKRKILEFHILRCYSLKKSKQSKYSLRPRVSYANYV